MNKQGKTHDLITVMSFYQGFLSGGGSADAIEFIQFALIQQQPMEKVRVDVVLFVDSSTANLRMISDLNILAL